MVIRVVVGPTTPDQCGHGRTLYDVSEDSSTCTQKYASIKFMVPYNYFGHQMPYMEVGVPCRGGVSRYLTTVFKQHVYPGPAGQSDEDSAAAAKRVWLARKKVYFFAVFANEFSDDLSPLSKVVDIEYGMCC